MKDPSIMLGLALKTGILGSQPLSSPRGGGRLAKHPECATLIWGFQNQGPFLGLVLGAPITRRREADVSLHWGLSISANYKP